ncbi:MAG: hypothetical protein J6D08_00245 [Lachnospiraceae bacterium]|nr:hypothetical protein [Lachnospiraceae bacterium]
MEENNNFVTNQNGSIYGGSPYGSEPQPQTDGTGNSSVYGQQQAQVNDSAKPQESAAAPVQLEKASEPQESAGTPVRLEKTPEPQQTVHNQPILQNGSGYMNQGMPNAGINGNPSGSMNQGMPNPGLNGNGSGYMNQGMPNAGPNGNGSGYYGQPNYQYQPQMQPGLIPVQLQPVKPKKRKTGLFAGMIAAAAVILVIVICVFLSKSRFDGNPEEQLAKGMEIMSEELDAYSNSAFQENALTAFSEIMSGDPAHVNAALSFTDPNAAGSFDNFSIVVDAVTDTANKQAKYDLKVGSSGFYMNLGSIVADDQMLYISAPLVFQDEVYSLDLENFAEDYQNSAWADLLGVEIPENYFELAEMEDDKELEQELSEIFRNFDHQLEDAAEYSLIKEKKDFRIGEKNISCSGVRVTIPQNVYNEAIEEFKNEILASAAYSEFIASYAGMQNYYRYAGDFKTEADETIEELMSIRFEQDYVLDFYMDSKGRIVNIATPYDLEVSSQYTDIDALAVDISFTGEVRALDEIEGGIYVRSGEQVAYLGISRQASVTEALYSEDLSIVLQDNSHENDISFTYINEWNYSDQSYEMQIAIESDGSVMELNADGAYTEMTKDEGYSFRVNNAVLSIDNQDFMIMSGTFEIEPTTEKIEVPESATNLLELTESEIEFLLYDILSAFE